MTMQVVHPTPAVRDIDVSKRFCSEVLGLRIVIDDGPFVLFEGHFSIHQAAELMATVFGEQPAGVLPPQGRDNLLLYFETSDDRLVDCRGLVAAGFVAGHEVEGRGTEVGPVHGEVDRRRTSRASA
jgi:catechol 2,3-dioxygenase-like lactoylglutathione lyase family enzyme